MNFLNGFLVVVILAGPWSPSAAASLPDFLADQFEEARSGYATFRQLDFEDLCARYGLDEANPDNRRIFLQVHFLHDLLTTTSASNCARGGFLGSPYFWHWIQPNPRHEIFVLPDTVPLTKVRSCAPYTRYATFADIDRVPALYLGDLVTEEPGYYHKDCGAFFTFGWCSEREMAYTALMTAWGFPAKIWQSGIHTYSMVWCEFIKSDGATIILEVEVDNTFDSIRWGEKVPASSQAQWLSETGSGAQVDWYNAKARAPEQMEVLRGLSVGKAAENRIRNLIQQGISNGQ